MQETISKEDLIALRARLLEDFEFYASTCVKIRTKKGSIVNLVLNRVQKRFLKAILRQWAETGRVRFVVLKARQQGLSTVISALQYWWLSQHPAQKGLVMAHEADSTTTLFDMYRRIHENCPEWIKQTTKYSSRTELVFDVLDTALRVATAGGRSVGRGETLTFEHLSEVGFWPVVFATANFNGLVQAVPEEDNTFLFLESTGNGMTGKFKEMWDGAIDGTNGYEAFFSPWFESDEYREPAPPSFERTPSEEDLAAKFPLDNDQLYWRRRKVATSGLELFQQEYPATPEEAFLSTGRPVFNSTQIHDLLRVPKAPILRMAVEDGAVREDERGELLVYKDAAEVGTNGLLTGKRVAVDPKETYVIGADVGMGVRNGDPSVAQVLDSNLRQVAVWRGIVQPDHFATILNTLGLYYNTAMVGVERNNHGLLTCVKLGRDLMYPNTYTDVTEGALEDRDTIQIGFYITERTRPLIIDRLRAVMRDCTIEISDPTTLREMLTFVVTETGKMKAEGKCHDDTVMAMAIANHISEGRWVPINVTDEWYSEAI